MTESSTDVTSKDGILGHGDLIIPHTPASKRSTIELPAEVSRFLNRPDLWLNISFKLREETNWCSKGHEITWSQLSLSKPHQNKMSTSPTSREILNLSESAAQATFSSIDTEITFSKTRGVLTSWSIGDTPMFLPDRGPILTVWRAPTDNDRLGPDMADWKSYYLHLMSQSVRSVHITQPNPSTAIISLQADLAPPVQSWAFSLHQTYIIHSSGTIHLLTHLTPHSNNDTLPATIPRLGFTTHLPSTRDTIAWCGLGPGESYRDSRTAQRMGLWVKTADELYTPYEYPQECGNRTGTRWLRITDQRGQGFVVSGGVIKSSPDQIGTIEETGPVGEETSFDFSGLHYTAADLEQATHPTELKGTEDVVLRFDAMHHGLGTGSCGPGVQEKYRLKVEEGKSITFGFLMEPVGVNSIGGGDNA